MSAAGERRPLRVAIVGLGPKGLFAFERLAHHSRDLPVGAIELTIYEPHPAPGAGPVYDPAQPSYLRMNFAAGAVDMWHDSSGPSFADWRLGAPNVSEEAYPPRADVGRYLLEGYRKVAARAPESMVIHEIAEKVSAAGRTATGWAVEASTKREHDEVLIATGHADRWDGALAQAPAPGVDVVASVFPVEENLSPTRIPTGSIVAIRGFALTMIDASLALTEGRGGRFAPGREPYLLDYEGDANEVARILPYSRTGRPMLAKPDPAKGLGSADLDRIASQGRAELDALQGPALVTSAAAIVGEVAERSLRSIGAGEGDIMAIETRVEDALAGRATPSDLTAQEEIERSIAVGVGEGAPGADWALGHAWRAVYPALVKRLGADGLTGGEWPAFRRLAAEMERIAFGPPPVNAAKLLALIECGKVDLSHLTSGIAPAAGVVVDAVIPAPGARDVDVPLLRALLRDGHVRVPTGRRGLELSPDVTCVGADGQPSTGLGAIGRPTEDWVIGNDTLNRALHPQPERWALRVVKRAAT